MTTNHDKEMFANVENPEIASSLKKVKARYQRKGKEAESNQSANAEVKTPLTQMVGAVNHSDCNEWKEWRMMSIAIDSGAAETVIPHTMVTEYPIRPTAKSESRAC